MYARKKQYVDMEIEARLWIGQEEIPDEETEPSTPSENIPEATEEAWTDTSQNQT